LTAADYAAGGTAVRVGLGSESLAAATRNRVAAAAASTSQSNPPPAQIARRPPRAPGPAGRVEGNLTLVGRLPDQRLEQRDRLLGRVVTPRHDALEP